MVHVTIRNNDRTENLSFPCSELYIEHALGRLGMENSQTHFVPENIQPEELNVFQDRLLNLDEMNFLAKRMESFTSEERDKFYAVMKHKNYLTMKDLINLTYNLNEYTLIQDIGSAERIGRKHYMTLHGCIGKTEMEEVDFAEIGKELVHSGKAIWTDYGLLFENEGIKHEEVYNGRTFPFYWYDPDKLMSVKIEYAEREEYVYLPSEEIAIQKAIKRLGTEDASECSYSMEDYEIESNYWREKLCQYLETDDIYEINKFVSDINDADTDLEKLSALMKCACNDDLESALILAERINEFDYIRDVNTDEEVGRYIIENSCEYELSEELEEFFDFDAFGQYFADENNGHFVDGGFLYGDKSVEEILQNSNGPKIGGI